MFNSLCPLFQHIFRGSFSGLHNFFSGKFATITVFLSLICFLFPLFSLNIFFLVFSAFFPSFLYLFLNIFLFSYAILSASSLSTCAVFNNRTSINLPVVGFSHQLVCFHWILSNTNSLLLSRTLLSIQDNFNNASIPLIFIFLILFSRPLWAVSSALTLIDIPGTSIFHCFNSPPTTSTYFLHLFNFFYFVSAFRWNLKIHYRTWSFILVYSN